MEEPRETGTFPLLPNQQLMGSLRDRQQMLSAALEYIPEGKEVTGQLQELENLPFSFDLICAHKSELPVAVTFYIFYIFFPFYVSLK